MPPAYAQTIEAEQIATVEAVPKMAVTDRLQLPTAEETREEASERGIEAGTGVQGVTPMPTPEPTAVPEPVATPEPVVGPTPASDLFTFKRPDEYSGDTMDAGEREPGSGEEYECPECGAGIAETDIRCPGCGIEFEE